MAGTIRRSRERRRLTGDTPSRTTSRGRDSQEAVHASALTAAATCVVAGLCLPQAAVANGRYPTAQQVIEDARDPNHLVVRATYGLLVTRDAGKRWSLICEEAVGYGGNEDPMLGLFGNGTLLAGTLDGLTLAADNGCSFSRAQGGLGSTEIVDIAVQPLDRARALLLARRAETGFAEHRLWQSSDNGASWNELGGPFGAALNLVATAFDAAPSEQRRIYVSGLVDAPTLHGVLLRTHDGAVSWKALPIMDTGPTAIPFLSAVAPNDPDTVYVRIRSAKADRLLVSSDAGRSWRRVLEGKAVMAGFALSPDGTELAIGFGLPERRRTVDCTRLGLWKASTRDLRFSKVLDGPVQCLAWTEHGLYACFNERTQGFEVGLSRDGGKSFRSLMKLRSVEGLACKPPSGLASACAEPWRKLCPLIGIACDGMAGAPTPIPTAGPLSCLGDAGLPVASSDAGRPNPRDGSADAKPDSMPSMAESQKLDRLSPAPPKWTGPSGRVNY